MKKFLFLLILLIFFSSCIKESIPSEQEGFSFSYGEVIYNPESLFDFSYDIKKYDIPTDFYYKIDEKEFNNFVKNSSFLSNFSSEKLDTLFKKGFLPFTNENFKPSSSLIGAYSTILGNNQNVYYSADTIGLIYVNLFKKIESFVEKRYNILILKKLLLSLMHQSLKEYEQNGGLLKEAAWRNTAFLCVALRLIDNNSPTPFIVSGIVRKELNLINEADGEFPSPLLSLDVENRLNVEKELCFDYSIFRRFKGKKSKLDRFRKSYLWLSNFKFPLDKNINFLQVVLFTQCLKDISVSVNMRDRRGDELWGMLYGFYTFFEGENFSPNFHTISLFLSRNSRLFKEFLDSQSERSVDVLKSAFLKSVDKRFLTFFPEKDGGNISIMDSLIYPDTGPDIKNKKFRELISGVKSCNCKGKISIKSFSCKRLSKDDFKKIFCLTKCLRFKIENIFQIFKLFPDSVDLLDLYGFQRSRYSFCRYQKNLKVLEKKVKRGKFLDVNGHLIRAGYIIYYDFERLGEIYALPDRAKYEISGLNILNFSGGGSFSNFLSFETNKDVNFFLEPLPSFYGYISDLLDFLRKKLLMEGLSDLDFDEYLLQFVNISQELEKISLKEIKKGSLSNIDELFLKNLFKRIDFIEEKSSERWNFYYNVLNIDFPFERVYGRNVEINRKWLGCSSELIYAVILRKYRDNSIHLFISPISVPFEIVSTRSTAFSKEELNDILHKGNYLKIKALDFVYDSLLY